MEEIVEIILDERVYSSHMFWSGLVRTIYESYEILYVINKNKKYINGETQWYKGTNLRTRLENEGIKFAHKNHSCKGYLDYECECKLKLNRIKVNSNEIKYVFEGKFKFDANRFNEDYDDDEDDDNNILKSSIKDIMLLIEKTNKKIPISNIKFVLDKCVNLQNVNGFNKDHRGLDHMIIELPFESKIKLGKEFTLEEIITTIYNLKSHKFDYWYELFCDTKIKIDNDRIDVCLSFDHGS